MKNFGFSKKRLLIYICCSILPLFAISFGVILLCAGSLLNRSLIFTYMLIPVITSVGLGFTVFYNTKTLRKVIVCTIILIIFTLLFSFGFILGEYAMVWQFEGEELETQYSEIAETKKLMPSLSEICTPIDVDYYKVYIKYFIYFTPETDYLVCEYTSDEYKKQKDLISKKYIFQEKELSNYDASCESITEIDGFTFKSLSINEESYELSIDFPKKMVLIGFSDKTNEIIYISFYDDDIDYISSFSDFVNEDCGWKYIRKEILKKQ